MFSIEAQKLCARGVTIVGALGNGSPSDSPRDSPSDSPSDSLNDSPGDSLSAFPSDSPSAFPSVLSCSCLLNHTRDNYVERNYTERCTMPIRCGFTICVRRRRCKFVPRSVEQNSMWPFCIAPCVVSIRAGRWSYSRSRRIHSRNCRDE